mgnify:CR=1 FL=1
MAVTVTLLTLKTDLGHILDDESETVYSATRKTKFINLARDHVQDWIDQWGGKAMLGVSSIALVADTKEYAIDKEVKQIEKVTVVRDDGTERLLGPVNFIEAEYTETSTTVGVGIAPLSYYRQGYNVGFLPIPNEAGTAKLYHTKQQDDLASDSDALVMPPWIRSLILFKSASYCASTRGDRSAKALFESDYSDII